MKSFIQPITLASALVLTGHVSANSELEELTVTASRNQMPLREVGASLSVLTTEDIERRGQTTVPELLRTLPAISVSNTGGLGSPASIFMRGEDGFRTKILIDGVDVSDPTGTQVQAQVQHLLTSNVERIEVLRGPQGMMYGADSGGVINIITKKADRAFQGDIAAEYGRYDSEQVFGNVRGKVNAFDYSIIASELSSDGFNATVGDSVRQDRDGYDNETFGFSAGLDIAEHFRIQATVKDVEAENEYDNCFTPTETCDNLFEQTTAQGDVIYSRGLHEHRFSYSRNKTNREFFQDDVSSWETRGYIDKAQYFGSTPLTKSLNLIYGLDWEEQTIDNPPDPIERDQKGVYLEWQGGIGENFFYTMGVRHDDNDDFGEHTSSRLTAAYLIPIASGDEIKLRSSYGTGFRAPSLSEIMLNESPFTLPPASLTTLKEEESKGFDAGVEYYHRSGSALTITYFQQTVTDEIVYDSASFGYLQETGESESQGVELTFDLPVADWISLYGNYTYNDTEDADGKQRIRRPRNTLNLGIQLTGCNERLTLNLDWRKATDIMDERFGIGFVELEDYDVLNYQLSYALAPQFELYVRGENALGEEYQEVYGYNTPGASTYGGFRYHF